MVRTAPIAMSVSGPRWDGDVESSMLANWPSTFEVSVAVKNVSEILQWSFNKGEDFSF